MWCAILPGMDTLLSIIPESADRATRLAWIQGLTTGLAGSLRRRLFDPAIMARQLEEISAACADWREDEYRRDREA